MPKPNPNSIARLRPARSAPRDSRLRSAPLGASPACSVLPLAQRLACAYPVLLLIVWMTKCTALEPNSIRSISVIGGMLEKIIKPQVKAYFLSENVKYSARVCKGFSWMLHTAKRPVRRIPRARASLSDPPPVQPAVFRKPSRTADTLVLTSDRVFTLDCATPRTRGSSIQLVHADPIKKRSDFSDLFFGSVRQACRTKTSSACPF